MDKKILIIEDEFSINDILSYTLKNEGYVVESLLEGSNVLEIVENFKPDLILLDLMLPDIDGFEICESLSHKYSIIILTAKNSMVDKIKGLELGADDYISKPFDIREVLLRVKAVLKRSSNYDENYEQENKTAMVSNGLVVDEQSRKVSLNGNNIKLKPKEFDLLLFLYNNKNIVFSREKILDRVWGYDFEGDIRTVDVHVRNLRSKLDLEKDNSIIETVFGVGYVMR